MGKHHALVDVLLRRRLIVVDGFPIPITQIFDENGEETDDFDECHAVVAGPLPSGGWLACDIDEDDRNARVH